MERTLKAPGSKRFETKFFQKCFRFCFNYAFNFKDPPCLVHSQADLAVAQHAVHRHLHVAPQVEFESKIEAKMKALFSYCSS